MCSSDLLLKIADINAPAKPWRLHYRWTEMLIEEWYAQGGREKTLGLPVSKNMDRNDPQVAKQIGRASCRERV